MSRALVFALPAGSSEISGGNLYNQQLLAALTRAGAVSTLSIAECLARVALGAPGVYFIDSLDLEAFADFPAQRPGQYFGLIVHHLPSLEPGVAPDHPALALERALLPRFDLFLVTSPFTADVLRARGLAGARILTVPPAPPPPLSAARAEPSAPFTFAMIGNLIPRKGVLALLEALASQMRDTDQFQLELAGRSDIDRDYAGSCLKLAQTPKLRSIVRYLGTVPHAQIAECYGRAVAVVSASSMETFGMALQEARAHGVPILALDGGYARQHFTPGANGLLFESVPALAHELLALSREPSRLQTLFRTAQRSRADSEYTWQAAAESFAEQLANYLTARAERNA
ncbi:MAG TPA: glycosyltransferase family 4 protein [Polyangiales bacterium]|nr:glycosyltransferase family 4 protein [Polyangiales bacterium]